MGGFKKQIVIDCRGHLLGRMCSIVAKQLMLGQNMCLVRTEETLMSGSLFRAQLKYANFKRKKTNSNPRHGPFHQRSPSKIMWRTIRGMIPHKTARGAAALDRLRSFEGCPHPYDRKKRVVIPAALKNLRLRSERRSCRLGDLSKSFGWNHNDLIKRLEDQRKVKSAAFWKKKVAVNKARAIVMKSVDRKSVV